MSNHRPVSRSLRWLTVVDLIFPYQAVVYAVIWAWSITTMIGNPAPSWWVADALNHGEYMVLMWLFVVAPLVTLAGYSMHNSVTGLWLSLAGDSSMALAVGAYVATVSRATTASLAFWMAAALAGCIGVRACRDATLLAVIGRQPPITDAELADAEQAIEAKSLEKALELRGSEKLLQLRKTEAVLRETKDAITHMGR
jgi:hypothetical protein